MSKATPIAKTEPVKKEKYRVTNWPEYDRALVRRGSLTVWFDDEFLRGHWRPPHNGKRGAPFAYSDVAIQTLLTLKAVFHLPYRAVEGLARSLVGLMGLDLPVPDHTQMSRRARSLRAGIPRRPRPGPVHLVVDSTGLKIFGEGEWKVRQHGVGKRRTWRKVHLGFDADVKDVVAVEVTTVEWTDAEVFAGLLEQVEGEISQVDADGAYDTRGGAGRKGGNPAQGKCRALGGGPSSHPSPGGHRGEGIGRLEASGQLSPPQHRRKWHVPPEAVVRPRLGFPHF